MSLFLFIFVFLVKSVKKMISWSTGFEFGSLEQNADHLIVSTTAISSFLKLKLENNIKMKKLLHILD